jgi:predicted exporter
MKNILNRLNKRFFIAVILIIVGGVSIFIASKFIKIEPSIKSLMPNDKSLNRSLDLIESSPFMDKVIVYVSVNDKNKIDEAIDKVNEIVDKSAIKFTTSMPSMEDIKEIMEYVGRNSLVLYPYESKPNPFTDDEIKKRLNKKIEYLNSMVFYDLDESFFMDPLMTGLETLKYANQSNKGKYSPYKGGLLSNNSKSYIRILNSSILPEDYSNVKKIVSLDKELNMISKKRGFTSFLYCSHLYYNESLNTIVRDVNVIFVLSIIMVILIFHFFFKKIILSFYSFIPILLGFAVTFVFIAIFKNNFGGIALAFGGTTTGISIDYTINYITRLNLYPTLKEIRKNINFSLILGFVTTIACFVFLLFSNIMSLIEIAIFGILSVGFSFLFSYFLLQNLMPPQSYPVNIRKLKFIIPGIKGFIFWLILIIVFSASVPFIKFEDNIYKLDMNHGKLNKRLELIKSDFNESTDNIFLVFEGDTRDKILDESLKALQILQTKSDNLSFLTPAIFMPSENTVNMRKKFIENNFNEKIFINALKSSDFSSDAFNQWLSAIKNIDKFKITAIPDYIKNEVDKMIVVKNNHYYLMIQIHDRKISDSINNLLKESGIDFFLIDIMKDGRNSLLKFEKDALMLLIMSFIIISILLFIAYKDAVYTFTALLPGITGLIAALSIAVLTMGKFNIMHVVSCILIMGIGVDYGIFMTSAYKSNCSEEEMKLTIQSIFICALTTIAGFGTLSISSNYSIFSMGSSILGGIVMSFLTFYLALPYILGKYHNYKIRK